MSATTDKLVNAYLSRLALAGYRPKSLDARRVCLRSFASTIAPRELPDATRLDVEAFLGRDHLKPESRRAYRGHVKAFYAWALDEEYVTVDPTAKIRAVRVPTAVPRPITEESLLVALAAADVRMRAWLVLMALGGLRCIEVANLRPQDLVRSGEETLLFLRECKGGGTAHVPAHPLILRALAEVPIRQEYSGGRLGERLWWSCSPNNVSVVTGRFLRSVGVNATAHQLRHFAGTSWYRASGHDLLATATLLRHKNVKTTMVYAQLDPTRAAEVVHSVGLPGLDHEPTPPPAQPVDDVPAAAAEINARSVLRLIREDAG